MDFPQAVRTGIEIVKLHRPAYQRVAQLPEAFSQAVLITLLVGIAQWLAPPGFHLLGIIVGPLMALLALLVGSAVIHFVAVLFGGRGEYLTLARVWGVGWVLGWALVIPVLGSLIFLWELVVAVVAVEEVYGLERTRAILTVLIPLAALLLLGFIMVVNFALIGGLVTWSAIF